ncbi:MAG: DUF4390 domain-containing protein [Nitrospinae bacterium]|nr:DUF4390 domain-containing protein [Nitrospinota bacterium]
MKRNKLLLLSLVFLVFISGKIYAKDMFISDIIVSHDDQNLLFYCTLEGLFDRTMIDNIYKGMEVNVLYEMELIRKRDIWFNSSDVFITITRSAKYSPLKKEFLLYEGEMTNWKVTNKLSDVKRWMTEIEFIPVYDYKSLEIDENYFVSVKSRIEGGSKMFFPFNYLLFFMDKNGLETDRYFSDPFTIEKTPDRKPMLLEDKQ